MLLLRWSILLKKDKSATRTGSSLNYSIGNEIYFYRDTITNQDYPSFYIANADGGNGYAIVSANPYTTPIIAYSESGNLSLSDTLQYPEISFFLIWFKTTSLILKSIRQSSKKMMITL
ncbi:Spi family protease inhibitor [Bacteroides fragilis]|nr:Spi family protease inhibitor [Bacteroides fragilis]